MPKRRVILWADERQFAIVTRALRAADLEVAACGSDDAGDAVSLAERLGVNPLTDLRTALADDDVDAVWIASPTMLSKEHVEIARRVGRPVLVTLPRPLAGRQDTAPPPIHVVPMFRRSETMRGSNDLLHRDDPWNAMHLALLAPADALPLPALLYSALDVILAHGGRVETVCAALSGASSVPETVTGLTGHLNAHLRLDGDATATLMISDRTGDWSRRAEFLALDTHLTITDGMAQLRRDGGVADEHRVNGEPAISEIIGHEIARLLDGSRLDSPPDHARLTMLCETVLLACRTGQAESPRSVERMSEHV